MLRVILAWCLLCYTEAARPDAAHHGNRRGHMAIEATHHKHQTHHKASNLLQEKDKGVKTDGKTAKTEFFKDVANSHKKLDEALKGYKEVADKEEKRATTVYERLGAYKTSIANLRNPLQQITTKVKELHSKIGKVLEADEKERLEPLTSLEAQLDGDQQSSKAESEPKEVKEETAEKEEKDLEENGEG